MTDEQLVIYLTNRRHLYPRHKDIENFRRLLKDGKIDAKTFIDEETSRPYVNVLIDEDILIAEIAQTGNDFDKIELIRADKATEYYDSWRYHPNDAVRYTLARKGYYIDQYLHDSNIVRNAALSKCPEQMMNYIDDETAFGPIHNHLIRQIEPDLTLLKAHIKNHSDMIIKTKGQHVLDMCKLKLESMMAKPTPIEQSMAEEQLKELGNPLWARQYSILELAEMTDK